MAIEFAALLGEVGDPLEPKTLVDRRRGRVRQRDPRIHSVHILALETFEQLSVEARADAVADRLWR